MFSFSNNEFDILSAKIGGQSSMRRAEKNWDAPILWWIDIKSADRVLDCKIYGLSESPVGIHVEFEWQSQISNWQYLDGLELVIGNSTIGSFYITDHNELLKGSLNIYAQDAAMFKVLCRSETMEGIQLEFELEIEFVGIIVYCEESDSRVDVSRHLAKSIEMDNLIQGDVAVCERRSPYDQAELIKTATCKFLPRSKK